MLKQIRPFILTLFIIFICVAFASSLEVIYNLIIRNLIDNTVTGANIAFNQEIIHIACLIGLFILITFLVNFLKSKFMKSSISRMKTQYMQKVFKKNINEFQKDNNAIYLSNLTNDYDQIEQNFLEPMIEIMFSFAQFAAGVVLFSIVNPVILFMALGLVIINIVISSLSSKPLNKHNKERSNLFGGYTSYIKEALSAFHIIKNNNLDEKVREDYKHKSTVIQQKGYVIDRIKTFIFAIQHINFAITFTGLIVIVGFMSIKGAITFGSVVLIVQSAEKIVWPIQVFAESLPKILSVKSIFKKIDDALVNKTDYPETQDFNGFSNTIEVKDVVFGYDDNKVLNQANLSFHKGGKYLLIGPSGGGKSTVLKLLRKYFNPEAGEILIDGIPLKDIKKDQYFSNIANVEQNVFLFEDTIRNNLTLYREYTNEEIQDAIARAGLSDFIDSLPEGLDTMIYDNGKNISGGEKSRLVIARGLLSKASILFLDEAFANLDNEKAKAIEKSILNLENVTVINVSHVVFKEHQSLYDQTYIISNQIAMASS